MNIKIEKLNEIEKHYQEKIDTLYDYVYIKEKVPLAWGGYTEAITGERPHIIDEINLYKETLEYLKTLKELIIDNDTDKE